MRFFRFSLRVWWGVSCAIFLLIGGASGWYGYQYFYPRNRPVAIRDPDERFRLINPLLSFEASNHPDRTQYAPLQTKIQSRIDSFLRSGQASRVSYYFRDLASGRWTGIHEDDPFIPASILKVFTLITYLRKAEEQPSILHETLVNTLDNDRNSVEYYRAPTSLERGKTYSISDLLERMIVYSGNNSLTLLARGLSEQEQMQIYRDLGIEVPADLSTQSNFLSPKKLSLVFRVLYNATYLSRAMSERALEMLSRTTFHNGLEAGLPQGLTVAHKFGERTLYSDDRTHIAYRELHDCGIVYAARIRYFACVMTQGNEFPDLERVIASLSRVTYDFVSSEAENFSP